MLRDDLHKFPDYKPGKTEPNKLKLSANEIHPFHPFWGL